MNRVARIAGLVVIVGVLLSCSKTPEDVGRPSFDATSDTLRMTQVLSTMDSPVPAGKNVVWCAAFQSSWKALEELNGEPLRLAQPTTEAALLSVAQDPRGSVPPESLYATAGLMQGGIIQQINAELKS